MITDTVKTRRLVIVSAIAIMCCTPLSAQITVGPNSQVSTARSDDPHYELIANAHPTDPRRLIACSMVWSVKRQSTVVYTSSDAGRTWQPTLQPDDIERTFDPMCAFGPDGTAYYVALTSPAGGRAETLVYRSPDGGNTWTQALHLPSLDREYLTFDTTGGEFRGRAYINGTSVTRSIDSDRLSADGVTLLRSSDGFQTFAGPVTRTALGKAYVLGMGSSVVMSDGTVVVLFGEVNEYWQADGRGELPANRPQHPNASLKVIRSEDGGQTLLPAETVSDWYMERGPWGSFGMPVLAVDPGSAPFKDRLYAAWVDGRSGRLDVLFSYSANKGKSWSRPAVVSNDRPPADSDQGRDMITPVVGVNREGVVAIVWADRRDHSDNLAYDERFAASLDGGITFVPSVKISSVSTRFGGKEAWPMSATVTGGGTRVGSVQRDSGTAPLAVTLELQHFFFGQGHTGGMAVDASGVFHPVWVDNRTGIAQLWTAPVTVSASAVKNGSADLSELDDVTGRVTLELSEVRYDRASNRATVVARLKNTSKDPIRGPIKVRVVGLRSEVGVAQVLNADNGMATVGSIWDFTPVVKNGRLEPDESSESKTLIFRMSDLRPFARGGKFEFGLIRLETHVLAKRP